MTDNAIKTIKVIKVSAAGATSQQDLLAREEPLEIRVASNRQEPRAVSVTMRTPGDEGELALGFLWSEGIITHMSQVAEVKLLGPRAASQNSNVVQISFKSDIHLNVERNFYATSSCGVCGKASLDAVEQMLETIEYSPLESVAVSADIIHQLPQSLRAFQNTFDQTGGLHAAALFDTGGNLLAAHEDVGRHNALDKLIGAQLLHHKLPLNQRIIFVSGRTSFELVQKTLMAGAPVLAAVGAPSSLAVDLAKRFNLTLIGFVRDGRFNIYSGFERIV